MNTKNSLVAASFFTLSALVTVSASATALPVPQKAEATEQHCIGFPFVCLPAPKEPFPEVKRPNEIGSYCATPAGRFGPGAPQEVGNACFAATPLGFILGRIVI